MKWLKILELGLEGGCIRIMGGKVGRGWRFFLATDESALASAISGEDASGLSFSSKGRETSTLDATLTTLDERYRHWRRFYPEEIHPDFAQKIFNRVMEKCNEDYIFNLWKRRLTDMTSSQTKKAGTKSPATMVKKIRDEQKAWAGKRGIAIDESGYTSILEDNLFCLSLAAKEEFGNGDGSELGKYGKRGKMQAVHSSSALSCNFFEYWRTNDATPLAKVLKLAEPILDLQFEKKFPTGLKQGNAPNLDVVLPLKNGTLIAIESKFLEPYGGKSAKGSFKDKYFESSAKLWSDAGFQQCQDLAKKLYDKEQTFRWLHAEQLLKHILGLSHSAGKPWELLYLWYRVPGAPGFEHKEEIEEFAKIAVSDGIKFRAIDYQSLFAELKVASEATHNKYLEYLESRYFSAVD